MKDIKYLEERFLEDYPEGFETEEMKILHKKHNVEGISTFVHENFQKEKFEEIDDLMESYRKLMSKSTLVSRFEKAPFKDFINAIDLPTKIKLRDCLFEIFHGEEEVGFNELILLLTPFNLAKWPVISVLFAYRDPSVEVFVKPTTAKNILKYFEVTDFMYQARPSYEFYKAYRNFINELKVDVNPVLKPSNPAFTGFLMMALEMI